MNNCTNDQRPDRVAPAGSLRAISRWIVQRQGVFGWLVALQVTVLCLGQWWRAFPQGQAWAPGGPAPFRLFNTSGWFLLFGAACWLGLLALSLREPGRPTPVRLLNGWDFRTRWQQRIFEDRPVSRGWLLLHGLFGILGFALGIGLMLRVVTAVAWHLPPQSQVLASIVTISLSLLAIWVMVLAARRIHDVLFLHHSDDFVGDQARLPAQMVVENERAKIEVEREQQLHTVSAEVLLILVGGFIAGAWLASKWLPAGAQAAAFLSYAPGLIGGAALLYLLQKKPRNWPVSLGLVIAATVGAFVVARGISDSSPWHGLAGLLCGAGIGVWAASLHLLELRRH